MFSIPNNFPGWTAGCTGRQDGGTVERREASQGTDREGGAGELPQQGEEGAGELVHEEDPGPGGDQPGGGGEDQGRVLLSPVTITHRRGGPGQYRRGKKVDVSRYLILKNSTKI